MDAEIVERDSFADDQPARVRMKKGDDTLAADD